MDVDKRHIRNVVPPVIYPAFTHHVCGIEDPLHIDLLLAEGVRLARVVRILTTEHGFKLNDLLIVVTNIDSVFGQIAVREGFGQACADLRRYPPGALASATLPLTLEGGLKLLTDIAPDWIPQVLSRPPRTIPVFVVADDEPSIYLVDEAALTTPN